MVQIGANHSIECAAIKGANGEARRDRMELNGSAENKREGRRRRGKVERRGDINGLARGRRQLERKKLMERRTNTDGEECSPLQT